MITFKHDDSDPTDKAMKSDDLRESNSLQAKRRSKESTPSISLFDCDLSWPDRPADFSELLTPLEAAQYLRLDEIGHTPSSAKRSLAYWRQQGELKATKYGRHVWYLRRELEAFLERKTET